MYIMCGRFVQDVTYQEIKQRFKVQNELPGIKPRYNITPGMFVPVITKQSPNQAVLMKWGLIPFWAKDPNIGYKMINARAETLMTKPSFRKPLMKQRCLVPTTGFYEWKRLDKNKIPYYIHLKDQNLFALAGLYDIWKDAEGKEIRSFTIITTEPNVVVAQIHNRMPAILLNTDENRWLDEENTDLNEIMKMLKPFASEKMETYEISKDVNNPENDSSNLIKPFSQPIQQKIV